MSNIWFLAINYYDDDVCYKYELEGKIKGIVNVKFIRKKNNYICKSEINLMSGYINKLRLCLEDFLNVRMYV